MGCRPSFDLPDSQVDQDGEPVAGLRLTFAVIGGGGSIDGADQTTNRNGVARVGGSTLGPSLATNPLEARAAVDWISSPRAATCPTTRC